MSGEGGMLVINDSQFEQHAEIIWEKGTNRAAFFRGEVDKYGWMDIGSSFLPSEIIAAFLWALLENLDIIQKKRLAIWDQYYNNLFHWAIYNQIKLPYIPKSATNNGHMFYLICKDLKQRSKIIDELRDYQILSVFHYQSLINSPYYRNKYEQRPLIQAERYSDCLVRLPFYYDLTVKHIDEICTILKRTTFLHSGGSSSCYRAAHIHQAC